MSDEQQDEVRRDFDDAVNMTPKELEDWLSSDESKAVGWGGDGGGESVGHESGRKIVAIKRKRRDELTDGDLDHMRKVTGYVKRHLAQGGPKDDTEHSRWRYSLMNWGMTP